jgi:hypothetical protein
MRRSIFGALLFLMASLVAFGQTASPSDPAQDHKDLQQLNREAAQTKQDAHSDVNDMKQDRSGLRTAVQDGNKAEAKKDVKDLRQDKRDLSKDKQKIKQDMRQSRQLKTNSPAMGPRGGRR